MLIIDFIKNKYLRIKAFLNFVSSNKTLTLILSIISFVVGSAISSLIGKGVDYVFPSTDSSAEIIANQNKQFSLVNENLRKLQSSLTGKDREYFDTALNTFNQLKDSTENLALKLEALKTENNSLKQTLKSEKGINGGVDVMVTNNAAFKIDSQITFGYKAHPNGAYLNLTNTSNEKENLSDKWVTAGQGVYFTNEKNQKCSIVFSGNTVVGGGNNAIGNFIVSCKKS